VSARLLMRAQQGVAVVTALLVAALITVLAAQWFAAQDALGRTVEVQRSGMQARWLLTSATDWARLLLREDNNKQVDYVPEVWSIPLASTRITDESGRLEAFASGKIEDAQSRFNLADLVDEKGVYAPGVNALQRLFEAVGLPSGDVAAIANAVNKTMPANRAPVAGSYPMPQIKTIMDLQGVQGIKDETLLRLVDFTTVYPRTFEANKMSAININTASAPVLAALDQAFAGGGGQTLISKRERIGYFRNTDSADFAGFTNSRANRPLNSPPLPEISFNSQYFIATGRLQLGRVDIARQAMIKRSLAPGTGTQTEIIWVRDI
jgi:general secretion pathway protein K